MKRRLNFNMHTMQLILSFVCKRVSQILPLRLVDKDFKDCIDNYAYHIWIEKVEICDIIKAFYDINTYVIRQFLEARKLYKSEYVQDKDITNLFVQCQRISINELLVKYWDINVSNTNGEIIMTPLIYACTTGCLPRIRFLLENGANPTLCGTKQLLPFDILLRREFHKRFDEELNGVINLFKDKTLPPLMKAINEGNPDLAMSFFKTMQISGFVIEMVVLLTFLLLIKE